MYESYFYYLFFYFLISLLSKSQEVDFVALDNRVVEPDGHMDTPSSLRQKPARNVLAMTLPLL